MREQTLGRHRQNLVHTRTQAKGEVTPQETDPDLPLSVQKSPAEAWVDSACCRVGGTECGSACMGPFEEGCHYLHYLHHNLALGQMTGRELGPVHQNKTQLPPQSVSPIRKLL